MYGGMYLENDLKRSSKSKKTEWLKKKKDKGVALAQSKSRPQLQNAVVVP